MNGIFYFSSTGNSLYIAKLLKEKIDGNIVFIPSYEGNGGEFDKIFIVTPIYSFGLPSPVFDLLPKLDKSKEIIVIQNYGGMAGNADYLFYDYAKNRFGLNVISVYKIKMTENFTLQFSVPKLYQKIQLKKCKNRIEGVLKKILNGEYIIPKKTKTKEKTYLKNKANWHIIGKRFSTNNNCTKCGKCAQICPVKNIKVEDKVMFGDNCIACLGCYHRCPNRAITYLNKRKKYRYVNPFIDENDIGKNFWWLITIASYVDYTYLIC